jgi:hypothetical protein
MTSASDQERIKRLVDSPLFPFRGEFTIKDRFPELTTELQRDGEGDKPCHSCNRPDRQLWSNGRWQITPLRSSPNPVALFLETVEHLDFPDFDQSMAAEFGLLTWRLEAAIRSLPEVGRVHINRWSDGSSHFHTWFQGRPARQLELYGWGNVLWSQLLDPLPQATIDEHHRIVIERFAASME